MAPSTEERKQQIKFFEMESNVGVSCSTGEEELQKSPENCVARINTRKRKKPLETRKRTYTVPARKRHTTDPRSSDTDHNVESSESDLDLNEEHKNSTSDSASSIIQEYFVYPSTSATVNQWTSDQSFLQHQIKLLKSPFEIEECSALLSKQDKKQLSKSRKKREDCIPPEILQNTLRKLNHRFEDRLQKHFTRHSQRKILNQLKELKKDYIAEKTTKQVSGASLQQNKVASLKKSVQRTQQLLSERKTLLSVVGDIWKQAKSFDKDSFVENVKEANQLVLQVKKCLKSNMDTNDNKQLKLETSKDEKQGKEDISEYHDHCAVVKKLFSN